MSNIYSISVCRSVAQCHDCLETCMCVEIVRVREYRTSKIDIRLSLSLCGCGCRSQISLYSGIVCAYVEAREVKSKVDVGS